MSRVVAVIRLTIAESLRQKIAVVLIVLLALVLGMLPFVMQGDETLTGRVQTFLAYSMTSTTLLLSLLTVFVGCGSVAGEIRSRQIHLTATKPVARWQILLGKWLGLCLLNLGLLAVTGLFVYGVVRYMRTLPPLNENDRMEMEQRVLIARAGYEMPYPDLRPLIEQRLQEFIERGAVAPDNPDALAAARQHIRAQLMTQWRTIEPMTARTWVFENLLVPRRPDVYLDLRYRLDANPTPPGERVRYVWRFGDSSRGAREIEIPREDPILQFRRQAIPADCVAEDGTLRVTLINVDYQNPEQTWYRIEFFQPDHLQLLYTVGGFEGNLARAYVLIYWRLVLLAAVGVATSALFGFPVACLVALTVLLASTISGFLQESLQFIDPIGETKDLIHLTAALLKPLARAVLWILPAFSKFNPVPTLVDGRVVTVVWILDGLIRLVVIPTIVVGLVAIGLFQQRELDEAMT